MERRRERRYPRRLTVRYGERELNRAGLTHDISASGVFVISQNLPPLDARIHMLISAGPERSLYFEGVVRRHRVLPPLLRQIDHGGFGVRFLMPADLVRELVPKAASATDALEVTFDSAEHLRRAVESEIRFGGVFVPTSAPFERDAPVTVELILEFAGRRFAFPAKVVQVITASARGVGVTFDDKQKVERTLEPFLRNY